MHQQTLIAGDSLNFVTATPDYPASAGWVLRYCLVPRTVGGTAITLTSIAEGDKHRVQVAATVTAIWVADNYTWTDWVELGLEKYTVEHGQIVIRPDPRTAAAGYDGRSVAEKALADVQAAFAAWTPTVRKYRIGEREREFNSKADVVGAIHFWQQEVAKERRAAALAAGLPDQRKVYVRINRE